MNATFEDTDRRFYVTTDPTYDPGENAMEFRLTYDGRLLSNGNPGHKHEIRRVFHHQLKRLWEVHPMLKRWIVGDPTNRDRTGGMERISKVEMLARDNARFDYRFVPLITEEFPVFVSLEILFLRPGAPGELIKKGDLDNRLKTLFDALRMPNTKPELGGYDIPQEGEDPFYCLLMDDALVTHIAVDTDVLLQPTATAERGIHELDCRLIISVGIRVTPPQWHPFL